ncbi:MAG: DEAD/DEAH box helicase [Myxococcales bacterium FL481]|nr:MAG: DEAD/DEAH box helicase [Myxococcales bacterium FL481]
MAPSSISPPAGRLVAEFVEAIDDALARQRFVPAPRQVAAPREVRIDRCCWDANTWTIAARGLDEGAADAVALRLRFDPGAGTRRVQLACTCPHGASDAGCRHQRALLEHVSEAFESAEDPPQAWAKAIVNSLGAEAWRYSLEQLRQHAAASTKRLADAESAEDTAYRYRIRIARPRSRLQIQVQVFQHQRATKGWNAGRRVTWAKWLRDATGPPELSQQVRTMLLPFAVEVDRHRFTRTMEEGLKTGSLLCRLVGDTRCTWADVPTQAVAVDRTSITVHVEESPDRRLVQVRLRVGGTPVHPNDVARLDAEHLAVVQRDVSRISVTRRLHPSVVDSLLLLVEHASQFPREQAEAVVGSVGQIVGRQEGVRLELPPTLAPRTVAASATPVVWLEALHGGGIGVRLVVAPHPHLAELPPGHGSPTLFAGENGDLIRVERILADEITTAQALARELGLPLPHDDADPWTRWGATIVEEARLVACLTQLERLGSSVTVRWSTAPVVVRSVAPTDVVLRVRRHGGWFEVDGEAALAGRLVPLGDLLEAVEQGKRYVELAPEQFATMGERMAAWLGKMVNLGGHEGGPLRLPESAPVWLADDLNGGPAVDACDQWRQRCADIRRGRGAPASQPRVQATLRDYQLAGYTWLSRLAQWGIGACLADDMGLGKTLQTLAVLIDRGDAGPALVVAPLSVVENWRTETEVFAPGLAARVYHGPQRAQQLENLAPHTVVLTSYGVLQRDVRALTRVEWASLVLDEAQAIKNPGSQVAKAARRIPAAWKLALTGTPVQNRLADLWSIFRVVAPGLLGTLNQFQARFVIPIEQHGDARRQQALADLLAPVLLRRRKKQVLDELPAATESIRWVELSRDEAIAYERDRTRVVAGLDKLGRAADRRMEVLRALTRLRQLACHPGLIHSSWKRGSAKLTALLELVTEIRLAGHAALVFSQFTSLLDRIEPALTRAGASYTRIDGSVPAPGRKTAIDAFQDGEVDLMLISLKAGGTGLNLTRASYVVLLDPWWNPAAEDQALGRAHRIGQSQPVHLIRLVSRHTVEERVLAMHAHKRRLSEGLMTDARRVEGSDVDELMAMLRDTAFDGGTDEPAED